MVLREFLSRTEMVIQRYKRIFANTLQARKFVRQRQESINCCDVLNKMADLGMPESYCVV